MFFCFFQRKNIKNLYPDNERRINMFKLIVVTMVFLAVGLFVFQQLDPNISAPNAGNSISLKQEDGKISVTIEGEIALPGIYKMSVSASVGDLIASAGGLLESADHDAINQDAVIADRDYFYVPSVSAYSNSCEVTSPVEKININTATSAQLATLTYISTALGEKIVRYREENGPYEVLEDIMKVSGIGRATYERIRDYITLR